MKIKYLLVVQLVALCFLLPSLAFGADEPVKIGDITAFTGEVLARTKGIWVKVDSAPHPVYSSDKVVTRRGRAEIGFVDGGMLRLDLDSNISIEQIKEEEGFAFKNKVSARQVNLLVGKLWFSVKVEKGNKFKVRTPTMTAAVRGSAAYIEAPPDQSAPTIYSFIDGDIETKGDYISGTARAINWSDIRVNSRDLPLSDSEVDNSNVQQAAAEATEMRSVAFQAASKADEASEAAQAAGDQAAKSQVISDKLNALTLEANANKMIGETAVLIMKAQMVSDQERIFEAQLFKEVETISEVQFKLDGLVRENARLEAEAAGLEQIKEEVDKAVQNNDIESAEETLQQSEDIVRKMLEMIREMLEQQQQQLNDTITAHMAPPAEPTDEAASKEEPAVTEELGYPEEETTTTTIITREPLPDTQDLPSSSPVN